MGSKYKARRFFLSSLLDEQDAEFRKETWAIIDKYLQKYQHELDWALEDGKQSSIRLWLRTKKEWHEQGGTISIELDDYYIKSVLGIIRHERDYNDAISVLLGQQPTYFGTPDPNFERSVANILELGLFTLPPNESAEDIQGRLSYNTEPDPNCLFRKYSYLFDEQSET